MFEKEDEQKFINQGEKDNIQGKVIPRLNRRTKWGLPRKKSTFNFL